MGALCVSEVMNVAERTGVWKTSLKLPPNVKSTLKQAAAIAGCSMNQRMARALDQHVCEAQEARAALKRRQRRTR